MHLRRAQTDVGCPQCGRQIDREDWVEMSQDANAETHATCVELTAITSSEASTVLTPRPRLEANALDVFAAQDSDPLYAPSSSGQEGSLLLSLLHLDPVFVAVDPPSVLRLR